MPANPSRRWLRLAVIAMVAALLPLAAASAAPARQDETIEVVATRGVLSLPAVPAVGVAFLGGGDLFDVAGTKVGEGYSSCLIAKVALPELTAHCTSAFRLAKGEIHLSSLRSYSLLAVTSFKDGPMAVIGGTGDYRTARGEASTVKQDGDPLNPTKPVSYKFTIKLSA
ncbi:allene oxide cyclase barrel-like domain-containing protein [Crossiella cryophila]|uniref:Dirigent protein n=1 Tax=Crossiella cryophila TaxID=43355 RepID=A0A7W7FXV9_9PSEU|nr:hypothetical protein [Crossiella cryophila]MBB4681068.1 hypothetical protein [Crossiella cryophila]